MSGITWECHVCGAEREDAMIGVHHRSVLLQTTTADEHVRYCIDRPECVAGAQRVSWLRPRWQCEDCPDPTFAIDDVAAVRHCDEARHSLALSAWSFTREETDA